MERLLNDQIVEQVREVFGRLAGAVHLFVFTRQKDCEYCAETRQLVEEVTALSDKLSMSVHDIEREPELARRYGVERLPGIVIAAREGDQFTDYGVRMAGIPAGHEFGSLIQDILLVSSRDSGLGQQTRDFLKTLKTPVLLQVFVTPTCPYCPRAVVLAHQMAMESPLVQAEMVEATEFPELADRHHVSGVPHTAINDGAGHVIGAVPELQLLAEIRRVVGAQAA